MRKRLGVSVCAVLVVIGVQVLESADAQAQSAGGWLQWGRNAQHNGDSPVVGQSPQAQLAETDGGPLRHQDAALHGMVELADVAGPRVIEQTIRQKLPAGFQRSEFLLEHGMLDAVVPRKELKPYIARALNLQSHFGSLK